MAVPDLSLVIPAYQEEKRLPLTMMRLANWIPMQNFTVEVIIVVESSPDNTLETAQKWAARLQQAKVIVNHRRLGKGGAVRSGLLGAEGKVAAFMDADGATDLDFLSEGFSLISSRHADVVIASRFLKRSVVLQRQGRLLRCLGSGFRWMTKRILGIPYEDTQCGMKLFSRKSVPLLFSCLSETGFAFDVEILLKARQAGLNIMERPCVWADVEGSTVHPVRDGWQLIKSVVRIKMRKEELTVGTDDVHAHAEGRERALVV